MRRFYRLVSQRDPPLEDLFSLIETGHPPYDHPELQRRAEEVSVWDSLAAVMRVRKKRPHLGYVAILEIPEEVALTRGRRGHWGIPRGTGAEQIERWIVEVIQVPSTRRGDE